ncbi:MAG: HU family DNA-binding protein [Bacteroidetes bacterium]|nr:HU family DNA-binding protein [Bacteroidota bacterium]
MNKDTLINRIRIKSNFDRKTAEWVFNASFEEIKKSILKKKILLIDEIGTFEVEHREMKTVLDYGKKAEILLPPKDRLVFRPYGEFLKMLKD